MRVYRGDVYYCDFGHFNILGSEQKGIRPVLVVQNDVGNEFSTTVIVAPLTSQIKRRKLPTHVPIGDYMFLDRDNMILTEQLKTISKERLLSYVVSLGVDDMTLVSEAIKVSLSI